MKNRSAQNCILASTLLAAFTALTPAYADLMVYDGADYPLSTVNPDPDAGLNSGNGLPATNVGGNPAGTSTGLRGSYGTDVTTIAGLSYTNAGGTLSTLGNAFQRFTGTSWSAGAVNHYRFMTTDPFSSYRSVASSNFFGWNGNYSTELYYSVLLKSSAINTAAANNFVVSLGRDNSNWNTYLTQNGSNWTLGDQAGNGHVFGPAVAGETVLIVCRMRFISGTSFATDYYFNPVLGAPLGTPARTITYTNTTSGGQFRGFQTRDGANILSFDEFRLGTTATSVMPMTGVIAPAAPSTLVATANSFSEVGLTWADNSNNEIDFVIERSLTGTGAWRQIAVVAADTTSYTDTGRNALTTYHYRIRAANGGGASAYSANATVTTPASEVATPPPTNMAGTANSFSEITLTWTENATDETAVVVQRSPDGTTGWTTIATLAANAATYQEISLTASTTYHYRTYVVAPGGDSLPSNVASVTTSALPAEVALTPISLPFADEDGLNANLLLPVPGITAYAGQGFVRTSSALTYPGITTTGNGYESASGQRFYFTLDTTLPGLARYVSGGQIGGSGLGVLYVRWLAKGVNAQEGDTVDFRTGASDTSVRSSVGTTFGNAFIRAMASSTATSGINTYVNSPLTPSVGTDLYVARFTFSPTGVTNMAVFVNQTTEGTPNASVNGAIRFNTIAISKFGPAAVPSFDEFRIATTFAEAVDISSTPMQTWYGSFGLPTDGTGTGAFNADPDADGVVNLLEYALDSDPTLADGGNLPTTSTVVDGGQSYLAITFVRRTNLDSGVTYAPESSADLVDWSGVPVQVGSAVDNGDGTETVVYRDALPLAGNPKRFIRVRVTAN
ncbi:MAG: fibronectin type III domain-containing protein [Burkholderiales bacterium]|nr:fibronectin type III domain-containing protein [Opitutaceae bacterium]